MSLTMQQDVISIMPGTVLKLKVATVEEEVRLLYLCKKLQRRQIARLMAREEH